MTSSVLAVVFCLALPVIFSYRPSRSSSVRARKRAESVHWRRRLQHAASGLGIAASYNWVIKDACTVVGWLCLFCCCFLMLHIVRRRCEAVNDVYLSVLGPLLRPHEVRGLPGAFWFVLGATVTVAVFPKDIALQSLLHLSVGDPVASVVGIHLGASNRLLPSGKSLAGTSAAFLACAMATLLLFGWPQAAEAIMSSCSNSNVSRVGCFFRSSISSLGRNGWRTTADTACFSVVSRLPGPFRGIFGSDGDLCCSLSLSSVLGGVSGAVAEALPFFRLDDNLSLPVVSGIIFLALFQWHAVQCGDGDMGRAAKLV